MAAESGSIVHLFTKFQHGSKMLEATKVDLKAGYGINSDVSANPISPRQVLIVRIEDILDLSIQPGELRENIVIQGIRSENFQPGSLISFESGAMIRLTFHCEPCKQINHLVPSLAGIQGKRGILGVVITSGEIQVGSKFQIKTHQFPALSAKPYERFLEFIAKIPTTKVVTYKQIIAAIGVDQSYIRAIPTYIKKTFNLDYPTHRILDSQGNLIPYITEQKHKLESEGIPVVYENKYFVNLQEYLWQDESIYL
jgi:alkylated DNA nucleotide flippase Atl1